MQKEQLQNKIDSFGIMKSEWLRNQIEGHLFFGLLYRYIPMMMLVGILFILGFLWEVFSHKSGLSMTELADMGWGVLMGAVMIYVSFTISRYQQAVIAWLSVKVALGMAAFIMMTVGTFTSVSKQQSDALPNFLLGLIWLPGLEFIPKLASHQKFITLGRIVLTIPVVYRGIQSGHWTWE